MKNDFFLISCEHGGNRIPTRYRPLFSGHEALLHTHRGYDAGALRLARDMAAALDARLVAATVSRLLIDLNRSIRHPCLYSEATRAASGDVRADILQRYYLPYRSAVEMQIAQAIDRGSRVVHVSCHSFTPQLGDRLRNADIGFLYDPARTGELDFCRRWRSALKARMPGSRIRMNYPYAGKSDGFTSALRKRFSAEAYLGMELEVNQKHVFAGVRHWRDLRQAITDALVHAVRLNDAQSQDFARRDF
jgi:predicted N-formylglutamate amidohydrolase